MDDDNEHGWRKLKTMTVDSSPPLLLIKFLLNELLLSDLRVSDGVALGRQDDAVAQPGSLHVVRAENWVQSINAIMVRFRCRSSINNSVGTSFYGPNITKRTLVNVNEAEICFLYLLSRTYLNFLSVPSCW